MSGFAVAEGRICSVLEEEVDRHPVEKELDWPLPERPHSEGWDHHYHDGGQRKTVRT
jgi:hypothetical protein